MTALCLYVLTIFWLPENHNVVHGETSVTFYIVLLGHFKLINSSSDSLAPHILGSKFPKNFTRLNYFHFLEIFIVIPKNT